MAHISGEGQDRTFRSHTVLRKGSKSDSQGSPATVMVWNKRSFVDLNPDSVNFNGGSHAYATNGTVQVGLAASGPGGVHTHAAVWRGTKESHVNLHPFLPNEYQGHLIGAYSVGRGVDAEGVITGTAYHLPTNRVTWLFGGGSALSIPIRTPTVRPIVLTLSRTNGLDQ